MFRKRTLAAFALVAAVACADQNDPLAPVLPTDPSGPGAPPSAPLPQTELRCVADAAAETLACAPPAAETDARTQAIIGGQDVYVRLTSTNVSYDPGTQTLSADVTVRNLLPAPQTFGTTDGTTVDAAGVQVFFQQLPAVTSGPGPVSIANATGTGTFTGAGQPYFQWDEMLRSGETTAAKRWEFSVPDASTRFVFTVFVATELLYPNGWVAVSAADTVAAGATTAVTGRLLDEVGNPIPEAGRTLTWAATNGGAFSAPTSDTDATGTATVDLTVGTAAGTLHALSASDAGGLPGPQTDTVTVGPAATARVVVTLSDTLPVVGSTVTATAVPEDAFGNAAAPAGDTIQWSATGGGSLAATKTAVDGTGTATVDFTVSSTGSTQHVVTATYGAVSGADTLVTKNSAPSAPDQTADAIGNVTESYAAPALLQGATDPEGDALSVVPDTLVSANGGHVELSADGGFVYRTAAGFTGTDTFDFIVRDAAGAADTATATVTVDSLVWFVDPSASAGGDGTDAAPFQSTAPLNGAGGSGDVDGPGHVIYLASGAHSGALELEDGQRLVGAGVALTVDGSTLIGATSHPTLDGAGAASAITLGANNVIHGLHVVNSGGAGVTGSGYGTLTVADAKVGVTGGPALDLSTGTLAVALDSLGSTGSASTGVRVASSTGTLTATTGSISGAAGAAFSVSGGSAAVTYGGTIDNAAGRAVEVTGRSGGTVTFSGSVTDAGGTGIAVTGGTAAHTVNFDGAVTLGSTGTRNTGGLIFTSNATGAMLDFDGAVSVATTGAASLLASGSGTLNLGDGGQTVTLDAAGHSAIEASGVTLNADVRTALVTGDGTNGGIDLGNATGSLRVRRAQLGGVTGAAALGVSGTAAAVTVDTLNVTGASQTGVAITNAAGAVAIGTGGVSAAGNAFDVSGGGAAVSYGGTITNTAARSVEVTGRTGGAVTLSGAISDTGTGINVSGNTGGTIAFTGASKSISTGANPGVTLASNTGANIQFGGGGLAITTTGATGFSATGGGTVQVTGAGNTLATGTGTAVNLNGIGTGASGLSFRSVDVNGAANGIVLTNVTGGAGLQVTGNGGSCTIATPTCTGGTIQNTTGAGVSLTNTATVALTHLRVRSAGSHGIHATGSVALSLTSSYLQTNGDGDDENSLNLVDAAGSATLDATAFNGAAENLVRVNNNNANLTLTVQNGSHFEYPNPKNSAFANSAISVLPRGSSAVSVSVTGSTFKNIVNNSLQFGPDATATGTSTATFSNNTISVDAGLNTLCSSNPECRVGHVSVGGSGGTTQLVAVGNTFTRVNGDGVFILGSNASATLRARIESNSISDALDDAFVIGLGQDAREILQINNNTITNIGGDALEVASGETNAAFGTGSASDMDLVFTNNTMTNVGTNSSLVFTGGPGIFRFGDADQELCLAFTGNTVSPTPSTSGISAYFDGNFGGLGGNIVYEGAGTGAVTAARVKADNPGLDQAGIIVSSVNLSNGALCQRPGI